MLLNKYNSLKRNKFVICSSETEKMESVDISDVEIIKTILQNRYNSSILDLAPYHYIVMPSGIVQLKNPNLSHNDKTFLSVFNDDIKILLLRNSFLKTKQAEIAKLIAELSQKYSMKISDSIIYIKTSVTIDEEESIRELTRKSIIERNTSHKFFAIYEAVIDNTIVVNKDIRIIGNREGYTALKLFSDRFGVPVEVLKLMNPHINHASVKNTDTIFLPLTTSVHGEMSARDCLKMSQYTFSKCENSISREGEQ